MKKLAQYVPADFETTIGKSRSAQYGKTEIKLTAVPNDQSVILTEKDNPYIIKLETPLLLCNENGFPECSEKTFLNALKTQFDVDIIIHAAAGFTKIEQYNQKWESKSGKLDAYKEGSVFVIEAKKDTAVDKSFHLGNWNEQGFGKCSIEKYVPDTSISVTEKELPAIDPEAGISHPELLTIKKNADKETVLLKLKTEALTRVHNYSGLKNHLIGRLIYAFENKQTVDEFESFIRDLQGKPAGEALKKKRLCTPDGDFKLNIVGDAGYDMQKEAWLLLLQTLRKLNKKENV